LRWSAASEISYCRTRRCRLPEAGFTYLFDGSDAQFANWQMAGGGSFARFGRTLIAQQDGRGLGLLFYKVQPFEIFVLRVDFLLPHPRGNNNDNSGVFVRFRDPRLPDPAPDPVDPPNNAASLRYIRVSRSR
jgi:hypothetical protein